MKYNNARGGQVIVAAVFVILILSVLGIVVASMLASESISTAKNLYGLQALNVAEGGLRFTIASSLAANSDFSGNSDFGPITLGPGTFSVHYLAKAKTNCTVQVTGTVSGVMRTVQTEIKKTGTGLGSIANLYSIYMGGGSGAVIGNNSTVNGNAFIYGNLTMGTGTVVTGDATATGNISGGSVLGSSETYSQPPTSPPTLETSYFDGQITIANTNPNYTGNRTFSGSLNPGVYYIKGNVTLNSLTLTGVTTIVATGTITVGNNITIGNYFTAIAAGAIVIGNNSNIGESGLWYSSTSITIGNSDDVADVTAGSGTSFITPGNLTAGNTFTSNGLIYAGSSITTGNNFNFSGLLVGDRVTIGNNAVLTPNPTVVNFDAIPGLSAGQLTLEGSFSAKNWKEVY